MPLSLEIIVSNKSDNFFLIKIKFLNIVFRRLRISTYQTGEVIVNIRVLFDIQ